MTIDQIPERVFEAYVSLGCPISMQRIEGGLINKTYLVATSNNQFIIQELSPIFDVKVIEDANAVAHHLSQRGINAPKHLLTETGQLYTMVENRVFRALNYLEGKSFHTISSLRMAESSGKVLGGFHEALLDFSYRYQNLRRHGGDYQFHQENLVRALKEHKNHVYFDRVQTLANSMIEHMEGIVLGLSTTARHAHGDPKISNIIFDDDEQANCLVDFDTLGKTGWSLEIADALRSWCNPNCEDVLDSFVDLKIAEGALKGYGSVMAGHVTQKEGDEIVKHTQAITLCLAMRYLADVLNEKYWAYDAKRFERSSDHNWTRANAMYHLFGDFAAKQDHIAEMVGDLLL